MTLATSLMPAFGAWLKSTRLTELSVWIGNSRASSFLNEQTWITPTLQSIHILAVAIAFSAVLMICLRLAGLSGRGRTLIEIEERYVPWIWSALLVLVTTGLVLLTAEPSRQLLNPYFWSKMTLIVVAALTTFAFQTSVRRNAPLWDAPPSRARGALRIGALGMVAVWAAIMVCGRWIAYGV
jgi:hypothetical protein